jgi:nucleotide-binding universal stress UspA family protein
MFRIHKILHPHDFSRHAVEAFHLACSLARDHGASVLVLHVNPLPSPALMPYGAGDLVENEEADLEQNLKTLKSPFPGVNVDHVVLTGDPAQDILRIANQECCDLIIMGTHGRKGVGRLLMGSVAEQVIRRARCPVVTIRNPVAFDEMPEPAGAAKAHV